MRSSVTPSCWNSAAPASVHPVPPRLLCRDEKIPPSQYIRRRVITVLPLLFDFSSRKRPQQVPDLHSPAVKGGPFAASLWILGGMSCRCPAHVLSSVRCSEAMFICVPSGPSQHRRILFCCGRPLGFLCKISGRLLSSSLLLKIFTIFLICRKG